MRTMEVAHKLGISADWLRRLERAGKIPPARRDVNGHRRYDSAEYARIAAHLFGLKGKRGRV